MGKLILCLVMIAVLGGAWFNSLYTAGSVNNEYNEHISKADSSFNQGLYVQAIEEYKSAITIKPDVELWQKVSRSYELDYNLRADSSELTNYTRDMLTAAASYPQEKEFWLAAINLQKDANRYEEAYQTATQAFAAIGTDDELQKIIDELRYKTQLGYKVWTDIVVPHTGYVTVNTDTTYSVINNNGNTVNEGYEYIGPINRSGEGVYKAPYGFRLIDGNGVERAVLPDSIQQAGLYSNSEKLTLLKIDGRWQYFALDGMTFGSYEAASLFQDGKAAVLAEGRWRVIDSRGETIHELPFDAFRLGRDGGFIQNDIIIASSAGHWKLFDKKYEQISDFMAEDIDIYFGEAIAFSSNGKWGFVDDKGNVVIEPVYHEAKSFSQGLAAVKDRSGKWGFINDVGKMVISAQFYDVDYFMDNGRCFVMASEEGWQELELAIH